MRLQTTRDEDAATEQAHANGLTNLRKQTVSQLQGISSFLGISDSHGIIVYGTLTTHTPTQQTLGFALMNTAMLANLRMIHVRSEC